ncbi:MAG: hypothetical protein R8G33_07675 [Gammaproteobacteria bacterium]|nr:hypothetical protein [Gammaproteobacteria bacterium]
MLKQTTLTLISLVLLITSTISFADDTAPAETYAHSHAQATVPNFFDPNAWFGSFGAAPAYPSSKLSFNAAHPSSWMKFIDPKTHNMMHMQFANPATYMQFMQPQFWMEFMKPQNMMAWMDMNQYAVMMNPQTMTYWMNPTSYQHAFDPKMYAATMNPANYMAYMNPSMYMGWAGMQYPSKQVAATE